MEDIATFLRRSTTRLAAFGVAAVLAVYCGFLGLGVETSGNVVKLYGYYFLLLAFSLWIVALWQLWRARARGAGIGRGEALLAGATIGLFTLMAVTAEPFESKVLYDEFVLQSTAYNMHYFRDTATMMRGYDLLGVFVSLDNYLDKRPNFYPFLISLVHDLTGYRPANAYWLNAALYPVTLGLAYYLGRRLMRAAAGGLLAVLLLGSLPLLTQNATGSGMELLNCGMILAVAALGGAYLRAPGETTLSALVLGAVLLAQSRYESAIYVLPVAAVIAIGWWRQRRVILSWPAILAPLLLVPCGLQNKVLNNSKWMWELKADQESRFSADYMARNLEAAGDFLFGRTIMFANSLTLTVLGLLAILCLVLPPVWRRAARTVGPGDGPALLLVGAGALANTVLVLFYYWSSFTDPMAARFSLPLHLILAFTVVAAAAALRPVWPALPRLLVGAGCLAAVVATSRASMALYSHLGIDEIEWEKRLVAARPSGERLIVTNKSTIPWLLVKTPSVLVGRARLVADRLAYQLAEPHFREILVFQSFRPTTAQGDHAMVPDDILPDWFELEPVTERRFGTKITRVSRLVAVHLPAGFKPISRAP